MGCMHASNSEPAAAEFTSIERSQCLFDTRRSLPDACTNSLDILGEPARFGPPGDPCIDEGLNKLSGAFAIITGSFPFPDDIKWRCEGAMGLDIRFHGTDIVRCHRIVVP